MKEFTIRIPTPSLKNPFSLNKAGRVIYERLVILTPQEARVEHDKLTPEAKADYDDYIRASGLRDVVKATAFVTVIGGALTGLILFIRTDDEDEEEDEDEESESESDDEVESDE